jgi:molybdopterin molybdotransferase
MLNLDDALQIVLDHTPVLPPTTVPLAECVGRALAEDIFADQDDPPYRRSAMDGFAARGADVAAAPTTLTVVEHVVAGHAPTRTVGPGECARIMTGGIVPAGADTVVMLEDTASDDPGRVTIRRAQKAGANVCAQGENFRAGDHVLAAGTTLGPSAAAALATLGIDPVPVFGLPTVCHLATGDEVVPVDHIPGLGQVRDSNSTGFAALLRPLGIQARHLGIAPDEPTALRPLVAEGLRSDVFAISAGVSRGDRDHVPDVLRELGVEVLFQTIALKPGKPTVFGVAGTTLVFGLPGNPVATQTVTRLLVLPALRRLSGHSDHRPHYLAGTLAVPASHKPGRRSFVPAFVESDGERLLAEPVAYRGSGDMLGLSRANALVVLAEDRPSWEAGELVPVLLTG